MIESVEIKNFRGFRHSTVKGLGRMNILVGESGSGKTSLLEAIYLAASASVGMAWRLRRWRGLGLTAGSGLTRESFEGLWADLFHKFDFNEGAIDIALRGSADRTRSLRVFYGDPAILASPDRESGHLTSVTARPLIFEWKLRDGTTARGQITLAAGAPQISDTPHAPIPGAMMSTFSIMDNPQEAAQMFSNVSQRNQEGPIVEALRRVYPEIESMTVQLFGGEAQLAVSMKGLTAKEPITLLSSGATKLAQILFMMGGLTGSVILIDEIENGFYYKSLESIWPLLWEFAVQFDSQLFITTHSIEALRFLQPVGEAHTKELKLLHFAKRNGELTHRVIQGKDFVAALEEGTEIR